MATESTKEMEMKKKSSNFALKVLLGTALITYPVTFGIVHKTGKVWPGYASSAVLYGTWQAAGRIKYRSLLRKDNQNQT